MLSTSRQKLLTPSSLLTYLLTSWCRVLLEKLTVLQLVKKFPSFHGTRMFITALTSLRHASLYWASPIQSIYPHPTSWISILILSTHLRLGLPSGLFPSGFPTKTLCAPLLLRHYTLKFEGKVPFEILQRSRREKVSTLANILLSAPYNKGSSLGNSPPGRITIHSPLSSTELRSDIITRDLDKPENYGYLCLT